MNQLSSKSKSILIVGFGSQAQAWAHCLLKSGYKVAIGLRNLASTSAQAAQEAGFECITLERTPQFRERVSSFRTVAMLIDDGSIGECYLNYFRAIESSLIFVLAHGFSEYSGQWKEISKNHELALLAPKAIGPKIRESFDLKNPHDLKSAVHASSAVFPQLMSLALDLGFAPQNCIRATFETETIGDLISEQGLLCGTVFTALIETAEQMEKAKIPGPLIREECLTELELIASLLRKIGPSQTYNKISQVAQAGTVQMNEQLKNQPFATALAEQVKSIKDKSFAKYYYDGDWKKKSELLLSKLRSLETHFEQRSE